MHLRKDEFLALLAHELRNPLAPIGAAAGLLRVGRADEARIRQISEITDSGIGMTRAVAARAFDLFAQAERTSDQSSGGPGLGLALVKNLVELHGGTVSCASQGLGKGSTFTVSLPLIQGHESPAASPNVGTSGVQAGSSLRIIVVDDNVDAASMACAGNSAGRLPARHWLGRGGWGRISPALARPTGDVQIGTDCADGIRPGATPQEGGDRRF